MYVKMKLYKKNNKFKYIIQLQSYKDLTWYLDTKKIKPLDLVLSSFFTISFIFKIQ